MLGPKLATRTRSNRGPDPSGAASLYKSGWIVPNTETPELRDPLSDGSACVPGI
jgi:hypothetical protein